MVTEGHVTLGGKYAMRYMHNVLEKCTLKNYMII